jgi:hypothetical protein
LGCISAVRILAGWVQDCLQTTAQALTPRSQADSSTGDAQLVRVTETTAHQRGLEPVDRCRLGA